MPRIAFDPKRWLFAACAACTAWLIFQNTLLIALVWLGIWGRP